VVATLAEIQQPAIMRRENPFRSLLGLAVSFPAVGEARLRAPQRPGNLGPDGRIASGVLLTLLDVSLGHAVASRLQQPGSFATVSLQVVVDADWPAGELVARGSSGEIAAQWRETTAMGEVYAPDGAVVARAQAVFARGEPEGGTTLAAVPATEFADFGTLLGIARSDGRFTCSVGHRHLNPDGVMHGGAMAAALDEVMRTALTAAGARAMRLQSFSVRYLLPARPGRLEVIPEIQRLGRRIHFAQAVAVGEDGRTLAAADATYAELQGAS
jgi:uncharacterized protein (TIGR00369 family)